MTDESGGNRKSFDRNHLAQQGDVLDIVLDRLTRGMVVVGSDYRTLAKGRPGALRFRSPLGLRPGRHGYNHAFRIHLIPNGCDVD